MQQLAQSSGKILPRTKMYLWYGFGTSLATADNLAQWTMKKPKTNLISCVNPNPGSTSTIHNSTILITIPDIILSQRIWWVLQSNLYFNLYFILACSKCYVRTDGFCQCKSTSPLFFFFFLLYVG